MRAIGVARVALVVAGVACQGKSCARAAGESAPPAAVARPAPDDFVPRVLEELRGQHPGDVFTLKGEEIVWSIDGGEQVRSISAGNFRSDYKAGQSLREIAARMGEEQIKGPALGVLPGLRERSAFAMSDVSAAALGQATSTPLRPVGSHLALALFEDHVDSMVVMTDLELKRADAGFEQLWPGAVTALRERARPAVSEVAAGVWRFEGDEYASAQVLLGAPIDPLELKGEPVVVPLNRNAALVAGSADDDAMASLVTLATDWSERRVGRDFLAVPVHRVDGGWADFWSPRTELLRQKAIQADYQAQKDAIDRDAGEDTPFVATYTVLKTPRGDVVTTAVLTETVETLLPVVDLLGLNRWNEKEQKPEFIGFVRFEKFVKTVSPKPEAMWPARFYVTKFPTAAQLKQLKPVQSPGEALGR